MKIIHTGDIHIGSAFVGLSPEKAAIRKRELMQNFRSVCEFAYREQVAAVLLVGDLFDENVVPSFVQKEVFALIENAAPVCFFYVSGNHDYGNDLSILKAQGVLPNNLRLFESENGWKSYDLGDEICITGADTRVFSRAFDNVPHLPREKFNIMLLHGQTVSGERRNAEDIPLGCLRDKNVDYLALGHIHKPTLQAERLDARGKYRYCGCLEGRGYDEVGDRGFFLLEVKNGALIDERFLSFSTRKVEEVRVDISACKTQLDIERTIEKTIANVNKENCVKIVLCGRYASGLRKELSVLSMRFASRFFHLKMEDVSRLYVDISVYENDKTERGEFIKEVGRYEMNDDFRAEVIELGLAALNGEEIEI